MYSIAEAGMIFLDLDPDTKSFLDLILIYMPEIRS